MTSGIISHNWKSVLINLFLLYALLWNIGIYSDVKNDIAMYIFENIFHLPWYTGNSQFLKPILRQTLKLKSRFQFLFLFYLKRKVVYSAYNSISLCMQASKHKNKLFL